MRSTFVKAAVLGIGAAALTAVLATPAMADPATVTATDIVGFGSDTTQFLGNATADAYNATNPARRVTSFDAFKPGTNPPVVHDTITIRPDVTTIRPNGSSEGITELLTNPQADYARSSRGPRDGDQGLLFLPVGVDGLKYAQATNSTVSSSLTAAQLRDIYQCGDASVHPLLPQSGSGTRSFFLGAIGLTEGDLVGKTCITAVQEHDFAPIAADPAAVAPFSVARFTTHGPAGTKLNTAGFSATRKVYNVVRVDPVTGTVPADLQPFFGDGTLGTGWLCSDAGDAVVTAQGFQIAPTCGEAEFFEG